MPDYIETNGDEAAFVSLREPAWHSLGTVIDEPVNTAGMLHIGHLDNWNVRVEPVDLPDGYWAAKEQYRTVRTSPWNSATTDVLGYVGERYKVFQNEELFAFADNLLDGGQWETAGSIKNGTRVFGSLRLNRTGNLGDPVENYLLVSTSHDGSTSIQASVTPVRVVCANTLAVALSGAKQTFKIRHTQSMQGRVQAAREALALTDVYLDAWDKSMQELLEKDITNVQFERLVSSIYAPGEDASKSAITRYDKRHEVLWDYWTASENANLFGTGFGAYNALNEELMWNRIGRGDNAQENLAASRSGFNTVWNAENNRLFQTVLSV